MDIKEVQISELKNLNLVYIFTTDNILKNKSEKYIGVRVLYEDNRTLFMDYKDSHFEKLIRRIIERYNKEKNKRNIILLGELTNRIIKDEKFQSIGTLPTEKTVGMSMFETNNFKLKKYESYFIDTLVNILKLIKNYEVVSIDKIDGYNHKFIIYYSIGSVQLQANVVLSFIDDNHLIFKIRNVDGVNFNLNGTIENNINSVHIVWDSKVNDLKGENYYNALSNTVERKITSIDQTIFYSEESDTLLDEDRDLINFYLSKFNIKVPNNIIKIKDTDFIMGSEEVINHVETEMFYKEEGIQLSISPNTVLINYQKINGLSKYEDQINVTLSKTLIEISLNKVYINEINYILVEIKTSNNFGTSYQYKLFKVNEIDFTKPFDTIEELDIESDIDSLYDVKRFLRAKDRGNK